MRIIRSVGLNSLFSIITGNKAGNLFLESLANNFRQDLKNPLLEAVNARNANWVLKKIKAHVDTVNEYDELLNAMHNLNALYRNIASMRSDPLLDGFFSRNEISITPLESAVMKIHTKLKSRRNERVQFYLQAFRRLGSKELKALIKQCESDLKTESIDNLEQSAKLFAARMALNSGCPAGVISDRGVSATLIAETLKANGQEVFLFAVKEELSHVAASLADVVIVVSSLMNHKENIAKLGAALEERGIQNYNVLLDPGWGVRSESPELSRECENYNADGKLPSKIVFVGPRPEPMQEVGDKWFSNNLVIDLLKEMEALGEDLGIKVIDGYYGNAQDEESLVKAALELGLGEEELMIKGPGGGGSGNKKVKDEQECRAAIANIRAKNPDAKIIIQALLGDPVHKEVQIVVGPDGSIYLGERLCTFQNGNGQKNGEESVSLHSEDPVIQNAAQKIGEKAKKRGYKSVLTVEFLKVGNKYYFLEMNPRLQVENLVTAYSMGGFSLVHARHWIAAGHSVKDFLKLNLEARNLNSFRLSADEMVVVLKARSPAKHVIQARVHAECIETEDGVFRVGGTEGFITKLKLPSSGVVSAVKEGSYLNTKTQSPIMFMLFGFGSATREEAIRDLLNKIEETEVEGIPTNLLYLKSYLIWLLENLETPIHTGTSKHLEENYVKISLFTQRFAQEAVRELPERFFLQNSISPTLWSNTIPKILAENPVDVHQEFHQSIKMGRD